ncbi:MAG: hypothetical protein IAE80_02455 [Anaerolinea sp.]|nr:hypothetical protein [Anaerolinea sp.]
MVNKTWDSLVDEYHDLIDYAGRVEYTLHAEAMLRILPDLREHFSQPDIIKHTSHTTLTLQVPPNPVQLCVWGEGSGKFRIYLYQYDRKEAISRVFQERIVNEAEVIATIAEFLHMLRHPEPSVS